LPTATAWAGSTGYTAGDTVSPTAGQNGFFYVATTGTSAVGEPTWPTTIGGTVVDNDITWTCYGILANQASLLNGGSGSCQINLDGPRTGITVTCSTTNPDFDADGWGNGDTILLFMTGATTYKRTISSVSNNVITISSAIPAGPSFYDGSALCLLPDRQIDRSTSGICVSVDGVKGLTLTGFYLEPSTGANCIGLYCVNGGLINISNCAVQAEDNCFVADAGHASILRSGGGVSAWGGVYAYFARDIALIRASYSAAINCTQGYYSQTNSYVGAQYTTVSTATTGYLCQLFSNISAIGGTVRYGTTGYHCLYRGYIYAPSTNVNNYGNTTNYNPAVTDTFGNGNGSITWS
ncbi:MAG: hypothetical protein ACXABY_20720, partial [Candidatus Thorarchaeota archaeon]